MTQDKGVGLKGWLSGPRRGKESPPQMSPPIDLHRIAVLPMANISPDPADAYFADGLTEELISTLSKISELSVISRTSVMQYRGLNKPATEIGMELAVSSILEGSVRKAGEKLRITAKLIDTRSDRHLWSETYDRDFRDIFAVQSDIATNIAHSLQVALLSEDREKIEKKPTENLRAYSLYLKGRQLWNERSEEGFRKGIEYLVQATKEDPSFAAAYSDLAVCYQMADYGGVSTEQIRSETMKNATKALELDPSLSEAHAALGLAFEGRYLWKQAEEEFVRAIQLNPKNANVRHWYAHNLRHVGKMEEAIEEWKKALELDPLSIPVRGSLGFCLVFTGLVDQGIDLARSAVELNESSLYAHMCLGNAYATAGMIPQAAQEARILALLARELDFNYKAHAASLYALAGKREEALRIQQDLSKRTGDHYLDPCFLGMISAALGDQTRALEQLEKAVEVKSGWAPYASAFPSWKSIRDHPKYLEITRKMGLA